jgi:hypothetical protein
MVMEKDPEFPYKALEPERDKFPTTVIADQSAGTPMLYSSWVKYARFGPQTAC